MLFLSDPEKALWAVLAGNALATTGPPSFDGRIRPNLRSAFAFYTASLLAARGRSEEAAAWLTAGTLGEEEGLFSCSFLLGFLNRQEGRLTRPESAFSDPRHFLHFATVPVIRGAREQFVRHFGDTMPAFDHPVRLMDIGCGDGGLTVALITQLLKTGKAPAIAEVFLVDSSPAMATLAGKTLREAFPGITVIPVVSRVQDVSSSLDHPVDIAVSSLAYHHMPVEDKKVHLANIGRWIDHFVLFELDANHDTPALGSPELAFSIYQSYGRLIDCIFSHDAPVDVVVPCVDLFLMAEVVSLLTEERGKRTDYHMLRTQWHDLFDQALGAEFSLLCDTDCYGDEYMGLFSLHYGRNGRENTSHRPL